MLNIFKIFKRKSKLLPLPTYEDVLKLERNLGLPERYTITYAGSGWLDNIRVNNKLIVIRIHAKDLNLTEINTTKIWLRITDVINTKRILEADVIEVFFDNLGIGIIIKHKIINPYMKFVIMAKK